MGQFLSQRPRLTMRERFPLITFGVAALLAFGIALCAVLLVGCTPTEAYVQADQATYEAVAPDHARYVQTDPNLSVAQKTRRLDVLTSWRDRLRAAGGTSSQPSSAARRPVAITEGANLPFGTVTR